MRNWKRKNVNLARLLLNHDNSRHGRRTHQDDILHWFVAKMGDKMYTLANHLVVNGMDPTDLPLGVPSQDSSKTYTIIDGNRRVVALKLLADPNLAPTLASKRRFEEMASKRTEVIEKIEVVVAPTRAECIASVRAKHYGESGGVGRVQWSTWARWRFDWMHPADGTNRIETRFLPVFWAINMIEEHEGPLPDDPKPPMTSLERMLNDQHVGKFVGFEMRGGNLYKRFPDDEIIRALSPIVHDIISNKIQSDDIKNQTLRMQYLKRLDDDAQPRPDAYLSKPIKVNLRSGPVKFTLQDVITPKDKIRLRALKHLRSTGRISFPEKPRIFESPHRRRRARLVADLLEAEQTSPPPKPKLSGRQNLKRTRLVADPLEAKQISSPSKPKLSGRQNLKRTRLVADPLEAKQISSPSKPKLSGRQNPKRTRLVADPLEAKQISPPPKPKLSGRQNPKRTRLVADPLEAKQISPPPKPKLSGRQNPKRTRLVADPLEAKQISPPPKPKLSGRQNPKRTRLVADPLEAKQTSPPPKPKLSSRKNPKPPDRPDKRPQKNK